MTKTLYLIRHGETDLNKKRAFYGSLDVSINETGMKQATTLKDKLAEEIVDVVVTSGMKRARQTADIIFSHQENQVDTLFNEKGFGEWEGLIADEIEAKFPKEWQSWLDDPFDYTPPDAESFKLFSDRVIEGLEKILVTYSETEHIAIVSHLGVIRVLVTHLNKSQDFWSVEVKQDGYLKLEID